MLKPNDILLQAFGDVSVFRALVARDYLPFYKHIVDEFKACTACGLCKNRLDSDRVLMVRGHIPCDVMYISYAGDDGDIGLNTPITGPAGNMLDTINTEAIRLAGRDFKIAYTTLVGCSTGRVKPVTPTAAEIKACYPRLTAILEACQPAVIVSIGEAPGKHATTCLKQLDYYSRPVHVITIKSPAWMAKQKHAQKEVHIKRSASHLARGVKIYGTP